MSGSQISPLTLAMLQAGGGGQNPTDPALAAALPRLQLAQGLMQQGTSDAPTTRIGILGRLGAALAGGYLANNANAGLQDILKQRQLDSANTIREMRDGYGAPAASVAAPAPVADASGTAPASFGATYEPGKTNYYSMVRPGESGGSGDTSIKNPVSSAQGPVQATDATWNAFLASPQGAGYTLADRNKEAASQAFTQWNGDTNASTIQAMTGQAPTIGHVVAAHLVGGHGAASLLANPDEPITKLLTPGAIAGNSTILKPGMTGAQAMASIQNYYGRTANPDGSTLVAGPGAPTDHTTPQVGVSASAQAADHPQQYYVDMMQRGHDAMTKAALDPYNPTNKGIMTAAQSQIQFAEKMLELKRGNITVNPQTGIQTSGTGGQTSAAAPRANFVQNPVTGAYESPGEKPVFPPTARGTNVPGTGFVTMEPGKAPAVAFPQNVPGLAAAASATEQGKDTGKQAVVTLGKMQSLGSEAGSAISNIDYGINQLHEAAKGGINAGYFAPWLATAAAAGKSLGVDLNSLGIDPTAVGNVQSAQKTLGVVAGNILQNTIGKDSAITDAKIEHFIHTQPGLATDPQAIERVLGWARSQFAFNLNMAKHAMENVNDQGMLPPNWQAKFHREVGFAPIYDPLSGEMRQPQGGEGPAPAMPHAPASSNQQAAPAAPTYREGMTASGPGGAKVIFRGGQWVPVK